VFSVISFVLAAIAVVLLPVLFGPVAIVLGGVGYARGDRRVGLYAIAASVVGMLLGLALGYAFFKARTS
jgi:hypothetical protein